MNTIAYTTSVQSDNALRMARVLAAGRVKAEREKREAQGSHPHGAECEDC